VAPSDIIIRAAKRADFVRVAEMHYPVWRQSWAGIMIPAVLDVLGPASRWAAELYPKALSRRGWRMWIAESARRPLGVAIFGPDPTDPDHIEIDALYIAEESQRLGIGGMLLDKALSAQPSGDVILWCAYQNTKGRRFYEKNNFQLDGRAYDYAPLPGVQVPHLGYRLRRR
jgi:ribosomal protein S18 acetylase RimI-like enzyme